MLISGHKPKTHWAKIANLRTQEYKNQKFAKIEIKSKLIKPDKNLHPKNFKWRFYNI